MSISLPSIYLNKLKELFASITHPHSISDITNLQTTLDGKAASSHGTHVTTSTCVTSINGSKGNVTLSVFKYPDYQNGVVTNGVDVSALSGIPRSRVFTIPGPGWVYLYSYSDSIFRINLTGAANPTTTEALETFPLIARNYYNTQAYADAIAFIPIPKACKIYLNNAHNSDDLTIHSLIIYFPFAN